MGKSFEISTIFRKSLLWITVARRFFLEKMKILWTNAWKHEKTEFSGKIFKNLTPFMHFEIRNFRAHHGKVSTFYWNIYPWKIFLSISRRKKPKVLKNLRLVHRRNQSLDRNFHYILGLSNLNLNWLLDSCGYYNIFCLFPFLSNHFHLQ